MEWVKATLKALGLLLVVGVVIEMVNGKPDKKVATDAQTKKNVTLPSGKFSDDVDAIDSNLHVYDRQVRLYSDMLDANYRLGNPNVGPLLIPDSSCPSQPIIIVLYKDMRAWKGTDLIGEYKPYMLQYENLDCQPDQRAYVLVGIHPVPGKWSDALLSQGIMAQGH